MTENLAEMINSYKNEKTEEETSTTETPKTLDTSVAATEVENIPETNSVIESPGGIPIISFSDWLTKYREDLINLGVSKLSLKKDLIKTDDTLIFAVTLKESENPEETERDIYLIKEAKKIRIPDLKPIKIVFYNNGSLRIDSDYSEFPGATNNPNYFIKTYITKTSLTCTYCVPISSSREVITNEAGEVAPSETTELNILIPYKQNKYKKDNTAIEMSPPNFESIVEVLAKDVNVENVIIQYSQAKKIKDTVKTNLDIIKWLYVRYEESIDMNHQLLIDNVILGITAQ